MTPVQILIYLGGAAGYALLGTAVLAVLGRLAGLRIGAGRIALTFSTLFVIFLGLHPFPDPAALDCSGGGARRLLQPLHFLDAYIRFWQTGRPLRDWLHSLSIISPIMNVVFFAGVGLFLAGEIRSRAGAFVYAAALTGFIETAQLTALFGIYPCPYRHFEIDDLLLNAVGVMIGHAFGRLWADRRTGG